MAGRGLARGKLAKFLHADFGSLSMFGFLRGGRDNTVYRQVYAGCCRFQHARFGVCTLPLLSYEAVFLYLLAIDAQRCLRPSDQQATCCRLRRSSDRLHQVDPRFAEFASAFGLLLASIKLEDDIRDDRSLLARMALWKLRKPIDWALTYFAGFDAGFRLRISQHIEQHLDLERGGASLTMEQYAQPTADAFGYVVGLYQQLLGGPPRDGRLSELGSAIGRAIICFDCATDWRLDRRRGRFNPLPDQAAVDQAFLDSQRELSRLAWHCCQDFGPQAVSASVAGASFRRVEQRARRASVATESTGNKNTRRSRKGIARKGDCDCDCDPSCCHLPSCSDLPCCEFDCPILRRDTPGSFCPDICPCDCCCDCDSRQKKGEQQAAPQAVQRASRVGLVGRSVGPLNPTGVVEIHGMRCSAKTDIGWIDDDTVVEVIREEAFGVVVRPRES